MQARTWGEAWEGGGTGKEGGGAWRGRHVDHLQEGCPVVEQGVHALRDDMGQGLGVHVTPQLGQGRTGVHHLHN